MKNWYTARIIRLVIALGLGVYAIIFAEYIFLVLTAALLLQVIFNASCCGVNGCDTVYNQKKVIEIKEYKNK